MTKVPARLAFYLAMTLAVVVLGLTLSWRTSEKYEFKGPPLAPWGGYAAGASLPRLPLFLASQSDYPTGRGSRLRVLEDGAALRMPHSIHAEIVASGNGRYSHWYTQNPPGDYIILSALDRSDPVTNGKVYTVIRPLRASLFGIALAAAPLALILTFGLRRRSAILRRDCHRIMQSSISAFGRERAMRAFASLFLGHQHPSLPILGTFVLLFSGAAFGTLSYVQLVLNGGISGNSIGGVFQVSDAVDYWNCAAKIIDDGATDIWCHRRPLASTFLAGVALLVGRNMVLVLAVEAALIGIAAFYFAHEIARWLGIIAASAAVAIVFLFAHEFALSQTMSESVGLIIGLIAAATLLRAGEQKSPVLGAAGVFAFTLGEMVRAGALFAIPALVLTSGLLGKRTIPDIIKWTTAAAASAGAAVVIHSLAVVTLGGDPGASNGNFAQTLYGLSVGGDWTALSKDHPELLAETRENIRRIYDLSFTNFQLSPQIFFQSLISNLSIYLHDPWYADWIPRGSFYVAVASLLVAGGLSIRSPRAMLVFAAALGELASALILARDGHPRVWATSGPLTQVAMPLLLGAVMAGPVLNRFVRRPKVAGSSSKHSPVEAKLFLAPIACILLIMAIPLTPLRFLASDGAGAPTPPCPANTEKFVIDLAAANRMRLATDARARKFFPPTVDRDRLRSEDGTLPYFIDNLDELPDGLYLASVEIGAGIGGYRGAYAGADIKLPVSGDFALCLDTANAHSMGGYYSFKRITSFTPLP